MTDTTVTTESPQNQPGPTRTADGTIADQSPPENTTPTPEAKTPPSTDGQTFLTGKKTEGEAAPEVKPADDGKPKPEAAPVGAPEKYGDFKLPDGYKINEAEMTAAQAMFKDLNLTQEAAQKLVDHYAKNTLQAAEAPYKTWADLQKTWLSDISDRFGSKADSVRTDISKAITNSLPPSLARSFTKALDLTGAGSHPDVVEGLHIMLKGLTEGNIVRGNGPTRDSQTPPGTPARPSAAEAMYPHLMPNRQS